MSDLEEFTTATERPGRPRVKDVFLAVLCVVIDLFFSGFLVGDPATTIFGFTLPSGLFILLVAVAYTALAWRRHAPWLVFLGVLGFCILASVAILAFQPFAGVALALYTVAKESPARQANPALALAGFLCLSNGQTVTSFRDGGTTEMVSTALVFFAGSLVFWLIGRHERRTILRSRVEQQRLLSAAQESLGEERQRIARDLHDILSHSMSAMILQSAGAKAVSHKLDSTSEAKQVTDALDAIESTGTESMRELHRLLGLLRTQDADATHGITQLTLGDVEPLIAATRHGGLAVQVHREGTPQPLDASVDLAAYHMVQESLTNAMKHAGRGAVVDIYETWEDEQLDLQVRSSRGLAEGGVTPALSVSSGTGLWGLRERVELAGGSFASGHVDGGFVTSAVLPVRAAKGITTTATMDPPSSSRPSAPEPEISLDRAHQNPTIQATERTGPEPTTDQPPSRPSAPEPEISPDRAHQNPTTHPTPSQETP